jgi:hypothetical protein
MAPGPVEALLASTCAKFCVTSFVMALMLACKSSRRAVVHTFHVCCIIIVLALSSQTVLCYATSLLLLAACVALHLCHHSQVIVVYIVTVATGVH